jgi:hypothetical protein
LQFALGKELKFAKKEKKRKQVIFGDGFKRMKMVHKHHLERIKEVLFSETQILESNAQKCEPS